MHKGIVMSNESGWIAKHIPEDIRLSVFLIFKVALLIFHHNHVNLTDYSDKFNDLNITLKIMYSIEMAVHLLITIAVNIILVIAIWSSVSALKKFWETSSNHSNSKKNTRGKNTTD